MSERDDGGGVFLFNPLPWSRDVSGVVPGHVVEPRNGIADDETSTRHYQDRDLNHQRDTERFVLPPTEVPGFGYETVHRDELVADDGWPFDERSVVETDAFRLEFDREVGGIRRWVDRRDGHQWVDADFEYPVAGFVHERVADTDHEPARSLLYRRRSGEDPATSALDPGPDERGLQSDWHADRDGPTDVRRHRVYETPVGYVVEQRLSAPTLDTTVELTVHVPEAGDTVVVDAAWTMAQEPHPEATYLAFPFDLDEPTARVDVGGQAVQPGRDQLGNSCHDYYTVQRWAALSNDDRGMTVSCPLNPMVQFGDFDFAANRTDFELDRALLLGWATNNYWSVNFRAQQPGRVRARYHLTPHVGSFSEADAHRAGMEAEHWVPLTQTLAEAPVSDPPLPGTESLLDLPDPPILALHVRPDRGTAGCGHLLPAELDASERDGSTFSVLLRNASDARRDATIASGALAVLGAQTTGLLGDPEDDGDLSVEDGTVSIPLAPRETRAVRLRCGPQESPD